MCDGVRFFFVGLIVVVFKRISRFLIKFESGGVFNFLFRIFVIGGFNVNFYTDVFYFVRRLVVRFRGELFDFRYIYF